MATVVVTFFLISKLYVFNMDADCVRTQRILFIREKRWSMNSQRLEEIVAELMKPISDIRRSFDTDISSLLEEYLTEAGLRALDEGDAPAAEGGDGGGGEAEVNFAELALLLQQSASIYSRKVDCLYQRVLSVSEELNTTADETGAPSCEPATPSARRKRKHSAELEWAELSLTSAAGARRDPAPRPPPTLPRAHDELAPRAPAPSDRALTDYDGEPIGLPADFHVCWRLQKGLLVEELATGWAGEHAWRPPALVELRAALTADEPPSPPRSPPRSPSPCATPPRCDTPPAHTPVPACAAPRPCDTPPPPTQLPGCDTPLSFSTHPPSSTPLPAKEKLEKKERKRKNDVKMEDIVYGSLKLVITEEFAEWARRPREFSPPARWRARVLRRRRELLRAARQQPRPPNIGFGGWSGPEAATAVEAARAASTRLHDDSDDDGFFERSSLGDSDTSRAEEPPPLPPGHAAPPPAEGEWRTRVLDAAAAAERRGGDVHAAAAALLRALPPALPPMSTASCPPAPALPFPALLADVVREPHDVAKYFLATLFLANAGNVEVIQGPPLSLGSFAVRLLSTDASRYRRTIAADAAPPT